MRDVKLVGMLFAVFMLSACVSLNTPMKDAQGQVFECRNTGWGWLGTPMALVSQKRCESDARERGFVTFSEIAPPMPARQIPGYSPQGQQALVNVQTPGSAQPPSTSWVKASIDLPLGWNSVTLTETQVRNGVAAQATNPGAEAFLVVSARSKVNLTDLRVFALAQQADQAARVTGADLSVLTKVDIAGKPAYMMHVIGTPNGAPQAFRFNMAIVEGASEIAILNVWLPEKLHSANKQRLDDLVMALKGLDS